MPVYRDLSLRVPGGIYFAKLYGSKPSGSPAGTGPERRWRAVSIYL